MIFIVLRVCKIWIHVLHLSMINIRSSWLENIVYEIRHETIIVMELIFTSSEIGYLKDIDDDDVISNITTSWRYSIVFGIRYEFMILRMTILTSPANGHPCVIDDDEDVKNQPLTQSFQERNLISYESFLEPTEQILCSWWSACFSSRSHCIGVVWQKVFWINLWLSWMTM